MICSYCQQPNADDAEACFTCGRALHVLTQGTVLGGRYVVSQPLGRGGMGHVYQARDRVLEEDVAVKVLRGDFTRDPELSRRFLAEIRLARRISHRNVCRIHEYGEDGGLRYLCMEFVDGVDLKRVLRGRALTVAEAFALAVQAAEGLEAVHALGIVHRDLKPSNIMVDRRGVVRLMDFGIAKEVESEGGLTGSGHILGTPEYMSPEQARGRGVGYASDVYALGCVIYECFSGRPPFRADTPINTLYMHVHEPPPFTGPAAGVPGPLADLLRRTLAKNAEERPSAAELAAALRGLRASQGAAAGGDLAALVSAASRVPVAGEGSSSSQALPAGLTPRATPTPSPAHGAEVARAGGASRTHEPVTTTLGRPSATSQRWSRALGRSRRWRWAFAVVAVAALGMLVFTLRPTPVPMLEDSSPVTTIAATTPAVVTPPPAPPPEASPPADATSASVAHTATRPDPAPTPRPRPRASENPRPPQDAASPSPARPGEPDGASSGTLILVIVPPSEVRLDEASLGTVSHLERPVSAGRHVLQILHPDYKPLQRVVTVLAGSRQRVVLDLSEKGIRRSPEAVR